MNQVKIGKFIQELRKEKNMTQKELSEKIGVSDKTVSKWETGNGLPDMSFLMPLSEILEITINELLSAKRISNDNLRKETDKNIIEYNNYLRKKESRRNLVLSIIIAICVVVILIITIFIKNKTFFSDLYDENGIIISLPKYSFYRSTGGMWVAKFKTLRNIDEINVFIDRYLSTLEKINCNDNIYYYDRKQDFTIWQYRINNDGISFINTIYIGYDKGYYCD